MCQFFLTTAEGAMRILFVHPNYHSCGAEIAGTWPPAWVAYLAGSLRAAGFNDIHFIDAMTMNVSPEDLRQRMIDLAPDVVGTTAITPAIYEAEAVLKIASEVVPGALRVLGGIHATFMYRQVLSEAPWVDVIVRGEGEEILTALMQAVDQGRWPADRAKIKGLAYAEGTEIIATPAAPTVKNLDGIDPDWTILDWSKYIYTSPSPTWRGAAPLPVPFAASGSSGAITACATPRRWQMRLSGWSMTMTSAFSSWRMKSPPSTARSSSSSVRN